MPFVYAYSRTPNVASLREAVRSRSPQDAGRDRVASPRRDLQRLTNHFTFPCLFSGQRSVCFQHELHCLVKVLSCLFERRSLRIRTRKLLDEPDIALVHLLEHGGQSDLHPFSPIGEVMRSAG